MMISAHGLLFLFIFLLQRPDCIPVSEYRQYSIVTCLFIVLGNIQKVEKVFSAKQNVNT